MQCYAFSMRGEGITGAVKQHANELDYGKVAKVAPGQGPYSALAAGLLIGVPASGRFEGALEVLAY